MGAIPSEVWQNGTLLDRYNSDVNNKSTALPRHYANLYYNGYMSEYYCTTVEFSKDGHTVTRAFALAAPAVGKEMMMSYDDKEESGMDFWK